MKNFQIEDKETGKKYWISRAIAVCGIVIVRDGNEHYVLVNKRGEGAPNYKGCWNLVCGYLDWDETLKDAITREVLEETKVCIPTHFWDMSDISDDPNKDGLQNVTIRFKTYLTREQFDEFNNIGSKMVAAHGGEENEVECVRLLKLDKENIDSLEWAFNHKEIVTNEMLHINNGL